MKCRLFVLAAVAALAGLSACGKDPYAIVADVGTQQDTIVSWALNGSDPSLPSGIATVSLRAVRVDSNFAFDYALDLDSLGRVVALPLREVGTTFGSYRRVGIDTTWHVPFDSVAKAHVSGYKFDSTVVVQVGRPFGVVATQSGCLNGATSTVIYSKWIVDSVHVAERRFFLRGTVDPNCGFRSFRPGIPTS